MDNTYDSIIALIKQAIEACNDTIPDSLNRMKAAGRLQATITLLRSLPAPIVPPVAPTPPEASQTPPATSSKPLPVPCPTCSRAKRQDGQK